MCDSEDMATCIECGENRPVCHWDGKNDYGAYINPVCIDCCGDCERDYMPEDE